MKRGLKEGYKNMTVEELSTDITDVCYCALMTNLATVGWPRHRENREFGSYFFQTGKTQGILL